MRDKRIIVAVVVLVCLLAYWARQWMVSDETRIRWLIQDTVESFNNRRAGSCVAALADDYREGKRRVAKERIRGILVGLFVRRQNLDFETNKFKYPVRIDEEGLDITIEQEPIPTARLRVKAFVHQLGEKDADPLWEVDVTATLSKETGEWLIKSSEFETISGRMPF